METNHEKYFHCGIYTRIGLVGNVFVLRSSDVRGMLMHVDVIGT